MAILDSTIRSQAGVTRPARQVRRAVTVTVAVAALAAGGAAPVSAATVPAWGNSPTAPSGARGETFGVSAVPGQAWAVGGSNPGTAPTSALTTPYAQHWDGTAWSATPVPLGNVYPVGSQLARLTGTAAVASGDVWAVGTVEDASSLRSQSLAYHWTGTTWARVATPNPGSAGTGSRLTAVAARSAGAIFAVGAQDYPQRSLVERWNGSAWTVLPTPDLGPLTSVAVDSAALYVASSSRIARFDGSRWIRLPAPSTSGNIILSGLARTSGVLWAVGTELLPSGEGYFPRPFAAAWNGSSWVTVGSAADNGFTAVTANGSDVLATAGRSVWRLRGTSSAQEVTPTLATGHLSAVTTDGAGRAWAVGSAGTGSTDVPALITSPGIGQGGIAVDTGADTADVAWFGPVSGGGSSGPFGTFTTGGLPVGTYTVVSTLPGCSPGIATASVTGGITTAVTARVIC